MKRIIVIPARYASTRLPGKPLQNIFGKPLIQWVYESASQSKLKNEILVATDDDRVRDAARAFGAEAVMTSPDCRSGTDRVFEAVRGKGAGIVVNVQGDEPDVRGDMIDTLFECIEAEALDMATLCTPITDQAEYEDPDTVKVVFDREGYALYFSRAPIPFRRGKGERAYKHIGIYGFSMPFLERFVTMEKSSLEETESLEQLRVLEAGYKIKVMVTDYDGFGIDTESDLKRFTEIVNGRSSGQSNKGM